MSFSFVLAAAAVDADATKFTEHYQLLELLLLLLLAFLVFWHWINLYFNTSNFPHFTSAASTAAAAAAAAVNRREAYLWIHKYFLAKPNTSLLHTHTLLCLPVNAIFFFRFQFSVFLTKIAKRKCLSEASAAAPAAVRPIDLFAFIYFNLFNVLSSILEVAAAPSSALVFLYFQFAFFLSFFYFLIFSILFLSSSHSTFDRPKRPKAVLFSLAAAFGQIDLLSAFSLFVVPSSLFFRCSAATLQQWI